MWLCSRYRLYTENKSTQSGRYLQYTNTCIWQITNTGLYNVLLLIKDKDRQPSQQKNGERTRHIRQDTQMDNRLMIREM